jgi:flagellar operon protein
MKIDSIVQAFGNAAIPFRSSTPQGSVGFSDVFEQVVQDSGGIRFSSHAQKRLDERSISFSEQDVLRIARSTDDAMEKGSKESLFLMNSLALVVGVPNRMVITVMEPHERENTVFTNIDSVVLVAEDEPLPF